MAQGSIELRVELVNWDEAEPAIRTIREAVFMAEQGVPEELEWDGLDPLCDHVLAWNVGEAIGTARMQRGGRSGAWRYSRIGAVVESDAASCRRCWT